MPKAAASKPSKQAASASATSPSRVKRQPRYNGKHPGGRTPERPSPYNDAAVEVFFARMATGLYVAQAADCPECPNLSELYKRAALEPEFQNRFQRAREAQQDALVDSTLDLARDATQDNWQVARLRIQAIQWRAARLAAKIYGEKSQLNVTINDALSDRLTAALKRQKELADQSGPQIEGVAEPVEVLPAPPEKE